jgi:hypothetical protein
MCLPTAWLIDDVSPQGDTTCNDGASDAKRQRCQEDQNDLA